MSRASVIVSREPPDPDMDPRVQDILMEEDVEDEIASTYSKNYETILNSLELVHLVKKLFSI